MKGKTKLSVQTVGQSHWLQIHNEDSLTDISSWNNGIGGYQSTITIFNELTADKCYELAQQLIDAASAMRNEVA